MYFFYFCQLLLKTEVAISNRDSRWFFFEGKLHTACYYVCCFHQEDKNLNEELASFRQQWHEEIQNRQISPGEDGSKNVNQGDKNSPNGSKVEVKDAEKEKEKEVCIEKSFRYIQD